MSSLSFNQDNIYSVLLSFLQSVLPSTVEIVRGQINRVPEPASVDFIVMQVINRTRLETNVDAYIDTNFTASVTGTLLNVTLVNAGTITQGAQLFGSGVAAGTVIQSFASGTGGMGTYNLNISQNIGSELMASGTLSMMQPTQILTQFDVHGPNSSDYAQIVTTAFRDEFAFQQFAQSGFNLAPLYADDPKQIPFINGEQQVETRWVIEAVLQANQVVLGLPQQFFDSIAITDINVDVAFPNKGSPQQ